MYGLLLFKNAANESLEQFAAKLSPCLGFGPFEERESSNYVDHHYFQKLALGIEITVCITDFEGIEGWNFCLWFTPETVESDKGAFLDDLADCVARDLALKGYQVGRSSDNGDSRDEILLYRHDPTKSEVPFQQVVVERA